MKYRCYRHDNRTDMMRFNGTQTRPSLCDRDHYMQQLSQTPKRNISPFGRLHILNVISFCKSVMS